MIPGLTIEVELMGDGLQPRSVDDARHALRIASIHGAQFVKGLWIRAAGQMDARRTGAYIRGVQEAEVRIGKETIDENGWALEIKIINSVAHASIVEDGHPPYSLVNKINWAATTGSIKRGKNGPYLHIPFKHTRNVSDSKAQAGGYTRASMSTMLPKHIDRQVSGLDRRLPQRVGRQFNAQGQFTAADKYQWAGASNKKRVDRKTQPAKSHDVPPRHGLEHRGIRHVGRDPNTGQRLTNPAWKSSKYHGLFKSGPKGHGGAMTIRTITPLSQGWKIPAMIGLGIARKVAHTVTHGAGHRLLQDRMHSAIRQALGDPTE